MAELDARRAEVLGNAARIIQRQIRTYIARKEFVALRKAAIMLQSHWRGIFLVSLKGQKQCMKLMIFRSRSIEVFFEMQSWFSDAFSFGFEHTEMFILFMTCLFSISL